MSYRFQLPDIAIPSKKNGYRIRFNPSFWRQIAAIVHGFTSFENRWGCRVGRSLLYWIDSAPEVKQAEQMIAWAAKSEIARDLAGHIRLTVNIRGRADTDNVLGVIFDGLQASGRIANDRQIKQVVVNWIGPGRGGDVEVEEIKAC